MTDEAIEAETPCCFISDGVSGVTFNEAAEAEEVLMIRTLFKRGL